LKKFGWKEIKSLDLQLIDMVLLISGGFVVLGEVVSPLFSISLVELFSKNISNELSQSLKIFFGYLFMAIPPLVIVYYQIKSLNGVFTFKKDYIQFNFLPIKYAFIQGIKGWLTIVPFVLLISLIMNSLIDNQNGSNPLLEIVLNNNNKITKSDKSIIFDISIDNKFKKDLIEKASILINGVSLTIFSII